MYVYDTNSPHDYLAYFQTVDEQIQLRAPDNTGASLIKLHEEVKKSITELPHPLFWAPYIDPFDNNNNYHFPIDILIVKFDNNGTTFFISDVFIQEWSEMLINHRTDPTWLECTR